MIIIIQDRIDLRWAIQAEMDGGTVEICLARETTISYLKYYYYYYYYSVYININIDRELHWFCDPTYSTRPGHCVWVPYYSRLTHDMI